MAKFFEVYFRGLVFTILAVFLIAVVYGGLRLILHEPEILVPVMVLIVMPLILGLMTEGSV